MLYLKSRKQRNGVLVVLETNHVVRHNLLHKSTGTLKNILLIDDNFLDVTAQIVSYRSDDQVAFLINEKGSRFFIAGFFYRIPQLQQKVQVPLKLLC